ncbi:MAG: tRNA (adenine(22)-N(1))-methyltransferase TrmK [Candidatus Moranbacteria bacterium]|nr:tRNA (adenine(22)-N(1))-methyltransferase TrmK [Candidatus Moranbacteria bacterium]
MMKPLTYQDYLDGTKQVLEESKKEKVPYSVEVLGKEFVVYPDVFSPKYFHDTEIFASHLPITSGQSFLEIGPGTGVISIVAVYKGAERVVAIDINPQAVANTQANIEAHHLEERVSVRFGNLYSALEEGEKFDTIFWNVPFGLVSESGLSDLEKSIYDSGYQSIERFVIEAKRHMNSPGRLLIGFSSTLGRLDLVQKFCIEAGMTLKLLHEEESEEVHPVKFELFEAR